MQNITSFQNHAIVFLCNTTEVDHFHSNKIIK